MKKIDNCENSNTLFLLLLVGIALCLGGYRIFSYLCEVPDFLQVRNFILAAVCAVMLIGGFLIAYHAFRRLQVLRDQPRDTDSEEEQQDKDL